MFARLKGAIDSQIAAEQAKNRTPQSRSTIGTSGVLARSNSRARPNSHTSKNNTEKDPSEFEDNDIATSTPTGTPVRSGTPIPVENVVEDPLGAVGNGGDDTKDNTEKDKPAESGNGTPKGSTGNKGPTSTAGLASNPDLPTEVRAKLRKLDKIEGNYAGDFHSSN
jgi:hypothetical protein